MLLSVVAPKGFYVTALAAALCAVALPASALTTMNDDELAYTTGQSVLNLTSIAPSANGNPHADVGFYRLGIQADLQLNANIKRLQLGCGGANITSATQAGKGMCDIDLENVRFTGHNAFDAAKQPVLNGGPTTDTLFRNPFVEFAVQNPTTASTRKIVGFRLGFNEVLGVLSIGEFTGVEGNAVSQNNPANHTGINSLQANIASLVLDDITVPVFICTLGENATRTGCLGGVPGIGPLTTKIDRDLPSAGDSGVGNNEFIRNIVTRHRSTVTTCTQGLPTNCTGNTNTATFNSFNNYGGVEYQRLNLHNVRDYVSAGIIPAVTSATSLPVNFDSALNFIHQLPLGVDANNNGILDAGDTTAKNVYFSLTQMGDNDLGAAGTNTGATVTAATADWLKWQDSSTAGTATPVWNAAPRGWSLGVAENVLGGFTTSPVYLGLLEVTGGAVGGPIQIVNSDLLQRPADNCFGGLTFC